MQARCRVMLTALLLTACLGTLISGCHQLGFPSFEMPSFFDKEEAMRKNVREAIKGENGHSRLIGDYIKIVDSTEGYIKVQGVGLVDRLDGTGEDPPASPYRTMLLDEIRKYEVKDPQTYLRSPNTALVIITAYIPPILKKGETIDVEVMLPDGSEAKSLAGGWLMPCHLTEHALLGGQVRDGKDLAVASGPILVNALGEDDASSSSLRRGRIPAGGTYVGDDRNLIVAIRSDYRTVRMSSQIANRIGRRFHDYDEHGIQRKLAEAQSHAHLDLIVHERYRDNYSRYIQCIRHMTLSESQVEKHLRMQQLTEAIKFGPSAEKAALQLEAAGPEGIPILKEGLSSPMLESRFHAGVALAYLGNADGVPALKEAADKEPAFRIFALAALAALQDGKAAAALTDLMNHESTETRYGAFRALSTMAPNDPAVRGVEMEGNFSLHPVNSAGTPLIHVTRFKKAEIVVFGADQKFVTPMFVRAGTRIMVQASPQGNEIVLKRIVANEEPQTKTVSTSLIDVIQAASELGATYPDVVEMLVQAKRQHNLPGEIAVDELPRPGRQYKRPVDEYALGDSSSASETSESVQVGGEGLTPNLFSDEPEGEVQTSIPKAPSKSSSNNEHEDSSDLFIK